MTKLSRRAIIQTAAVVPFQAVRGTAQNSAIKVGLIGAGSRGSYTGTEIVKNPGVKITAVCDVVDEQIAKARERIGAKDAKGYKDFRDVLASDVDAVMIATAGLSASRALRSRRPLRQAHLHGKTRRPRRRRMQARDARLRCR